jgi:tetratricopeptide (TPR) repeat protein
LDGSEISRQPSSCEFYNDLAKHSAAACPIQDSGDEFHYIIRDGRYRQVPGPEPSGEAASDGKEARRLNEEGMQLMKAGNYAEAAERFIDALEKKSDSGLFANNAGFACYKTGRYEEALSYIRASTDMDQNRPVAYLNLGDVLAKLNRNTEARQAYTEYLKFDSDSKAASEIKRKLEALPPNP